LPFQGVCYPVNQQPTPRPSSFQPFQDCTNSSTCLALDMNLICNTNLTMRGDQGQCRCRTNFRWNTEEGECQFYNNVDCSDFTYDTPPSPIILEAVEKAKQRLNATEACPKPKFLCEDATTCLENSQVCNGISDCPLWVTGPGGEDEECLDDGSGEEPEEVQEGDPSASTQAPTPYPTQLHNKLSPRRHLTNSLLKQIDPSKATADELREAFCRDVYAFSFEFQPASPSQTVSLPPPHRTSNETSTTYGEHDERPDKGYCQKIPQGVCAVAYDSSTCKDDGWKLMLPEGQIQFRFWSSKFKYRNDMDLIAVRDGCTFTGFSDSEFNGNSGVVTAKGWDRWVVFGSSSQYRHLEEDIESVICRCG